MYLQFSQSSSLEAGVATTVFEWIVKYIAAVGNVELSNDGGSNALTSFKVQGQDHPEGEFYDILSSDYATLGNFLKGVSGAPATLAHSAKAHLRLDLAGFYAIRFVATSSSGTSVTIRGGTSLSNPNIT